MDKCDIRIANGKEMTPLEVLYERGKFETPILSGTPSAINLDTMKQLA